MPLQDIVNINTSLDTTAIATAGFGYPLFISEGQYFTDRVRSYSSFNAAKEDLPENTGAYQAALAYFSQKVKPELIYVGKRQAVSTVIRLYGTGFVGDGASEGEPYVGKVFSMNFYNESDGSTGAITTTAVGNITTDANDFAGKINSEPDNATTGVVITAATATEAAYADITITWAGSSSGIGTFNNVVEISNTSSESITDAYTAIQENDNSWYAVEIESEAVTDIKALAAVIETDTKVFITSYSDSVVYAGAPVLPIPTDDVADFFKEQNYFRSSVLYHDESKVLFPAAGWQGRCLPLEAGTITWANKVLTGVGGTSKQVTTGLELTGTQQQNLWKRNCNFIQSVAGTAITRTGKVASGEWLDVIRGRDALDAELTSTLQTLLINNEKIPYTQAGIDNVSNTVTTVLQRHVDKGFLVSFEVNTPSIDDIPFEDFVARIFDSLTWVGYLAGAIHVITINGSLTYTGA